MNSSLRISRYFTIFKKSGDAARVLKRNKKDSSLQNDYTSLVVVFFIGVPVLNKYLQ